MKKLSERKLIAWAVFLTFFAGQLLPSPSLFAEENSPSEVKISQEREFKLDLPPDLGTIQSLVSGQGATLIHLQDAHGNYEAQKKIEAILHHLKNQYDVKLLLVEGSAFKLNPELIRLFPQSMDFTREVLDELAKGAIAQGEELFLADASEVEAYGIEDPEAYLANGQAFREVLTQQKKTANFIQDMDLQIDRLTGPFMNKDLRLLLKRLEDYELKRLSIMDWLHYLKMEARRFLGFDLTDPAWQIDWPMLVRIIKLAEFESKLDGEKLEKERAEFLAVIARSLEEATKQSHEIASTSSGTLSRNDYDQIKSLLSSPLSRHQLPDPETGLLFERMAAALGEDFNYDAYPNMKMFIGHLILQSEVKGERLMEEMNRVTEQVSQTLAKTEAEKTLLDLLKDHRLLKRLFALELTPEDYDQIESKDLSPSSMLTRFLALNQDSRVRNVKFAHTEEIDLLYEKALEFYRGVKTRDVLMMQNIETRLKETGADKAVVITGGFHAEPFRNHFSKRGFNYALIAPKITAADGREAYIRSILQFATHKAVDKLAFESFELAAQGVNPESVDLAILSTTSLVAARRGAALENFLSESPRFAGTQIEREQGPNGEEGFGIKFPDEGGYYWLGTTEARFATERRVPVMNFGEMIVRKPASIPQAEQRTATEQKERIIQALLADPSKVDRFSAETILGRISPSDSHLKESLEKLQASNVPWVKELATQALKKISLRAEARATKEDENRKLTEKIKETEKKLEKAKGEEREKLVKKRNQLITRRRRLDPERRAEVRSIGGMSTGFWAFTSLALGTITFYITLRNAAQTARNTELEDRYEEARKATVNALQTARLNLQAAEEKLAAIHEKYGDPRAGGRAEARAIPPETLLALATLGTSLSLVRFLRRKINESEQKGLDSFEFHQDLWQAQAAQDAVWEGKHEAAQGIVDKLSKKYPDFTRAEARGKETIQAAAVLTSVQSVLSQIVQRSSEDKALKILVYFERLQPGNNAINLIQEFEAENGNLWYAVRPSLPPVTLEEAATIVGDRLARFSEWDLNGQYQISHEQEEGGFEIITISRIMEDTKPEDARAEARSKENELLSKAIDNLQRARSFLAVDGDEYNSILQIESLIEERQYLSANNAVTTLKAALSTEKPGQRRSAAFPSDHPLIKHLQESINALEILNQDVRAEARDRTDDDDEVLIDDEPSGDRRPKTAPRDDDDESSRAELRNISFDKLAKEINLMIPVAEQAFTGKDGEGRFYPAVTGVGLRKDREIVVLFGPLFYFLPSGPVEVGSIKIGEREGLGEQAAARIQEIFSAENQDVTQVGFSIIVERNVIKVFPSSKSEAAPDESPRTEVRAPVDFVSEPSLPALVSGVAPVAVSAAGPPAGTPPVSTLFSPLTVLVARTVRYRILPLNLPPEVQKEILIGLGYPEAHEAFAIAEPLAIEAPSVFEEIAGASGPLKVEFTSDYERSLAERFAAVPGNHLQAIGLDNFWQIEFMKDASVFLTLLQNIAVAQEATGTKKPLILIVSDDEKRTFEELRNLLTNRNNGLDASQRILAPEFASRLTDFIQVVLPEAGENDIQAFNRYIEANPGTGTLLSQVSELAGEGNFVAESVLAKDLQAMPYVVTEILIALGNYSHLKETDPARAEELLPAALLRESKLVISIVRRTGGGVLFVIGSLTQFVESLKGQRFIRIAA